MRRFITKVDIDTLLAAGKTTLECPPDTTITDLALEYARSRGMSVRRVDAASSSYSSSSSSSASASSAGASSAAAASGDAAERAAVRAAVVAKLGSAPPDLDAVIERAMRGQ